MTNDDKTMLALAALTYRGFGKHSEAAIDAALRPWLPKLVEEGLGKWDLVWGPASFRAPTSLFDDAMIYVAQQKDRPAGARPRYAIAIRGTNPVSAFDWVFGDFWVSLQIDWSPGAPAKVSASTALGMAILKHLAAEVPPSGGGKLARFGNAVASAFEHLAGTLPELEPRRMLTESHTFTESNLLDRIEALSQAAREKVRIGPLGPLFDRFAGSTQQLQDEIRRRIFDGLIRDIESTKDKGTKLRSFLDGIEPNALVSVTGHSKGGALAVATALWLQEEWVPTHPAEIECFSFAGPTPGNGEFAKRYNAQLAAKTRRIVNRRDVVPHAFVADELRGLREFYAPLGPALNALSDSVAPLAYTHVGGETIQIGSNAKGGSLIQEIIHQHLDAYLMDAAYKGSSWNTHAIFLESQN